jgi:hypothetical protein
MTAGPVLPARIRTLEAAAPLAKQEAPILGEQRFVDVLEGFMEDAHANKQEDVSDLHGESTPAEEADMQQAAEAALMTLHALPREQKPGVGAVDAPPADPGRAAAGLYVWAFGPPADDLRQAPDKREGQRERAEASSSAQVYELPMAVEERTLSRFAVETVRSRHDVSPRDPWQPDSPASEEPPMEPDTVTFVSAPIEPDVAPQAAPALQILAHLTAQLAPSPQPAAAASPAKPVRALDLPEAPGRVMSLRFTLQPEELGEVEVTLRRTGQETKVTIAVAATAAAESLGRDLTLLEDKLGSLLAAGPAQSVTVTLQSPDPQAAQAGQAGGGQGFGEAALAGGRGSGGNGRPEPEQPQAKLNMTRHEPDEDDPAPRTAAGRLRVV